MNLEAARLLVDAAFKAAVEAAAIDGATFLFDQPYPSLPVVAQVSTYIIPPEALDLSPEDFTAQHATPAGNFVAATLLQESVGARYFVTLQLIDRPARRVGNNYRPRALVVTLYGWA